MLCIQHALLINFKGFQQSHPSVYVGDHDLEEGLQELFEFFKEEVDIYLLAAVKAYLDFRSRSTIPKPPIEPRP